VRTPDLAVLGIWLLVFAFAVIVVELALAGYWTARVARRAQVLSAQLASQQAVLQADVERLRANLAETQLLSQPYRRVLRLLRHPITIALMQSFARRMAG
jgi:multidrug efflux pump subunit AcrA (membrane-fusion protein)